MKRPSFLAFAFALLVGAVSPSRADVVTFDQGAGAVWAPCQWVSPCGSGLRGFANWYREGMMNVTGGFWLFSNAAAQIQIDGNGQTFALAGLGAFDLLEVTVLGSGRSSWDVPSIFRSSTGAEITLAPLSGTYLFPEEGWRGITSFTWSMPRYPYDGYDLDDSAWIDNVRFVAVSEPSIVALLLAGAAGVAGRRIRRVRR